MNKSKVTKKKPFAASEDRQEKVARQKYKANFAQGNRDSQLKQTKKTVSRTTSEAEIQCRSRHF